MPRARRDSPTGPAPGWVLTPGASMARSGSLLVARAGDRIWSIRAPPVPARAPAPYAAHRRGEAEQLSQLAVLSAIPEHVEVLDMLGVRPEPAARDMEHLTRIDARTPGVPLLLIADANEPAFRDAIATLEPPYVAVWVTHRSAAVLRGAPGAPCLACAIASDGELARYALPEPEIERGRHLSAALTGLARFLAEHAMATVGELAPPGHVRAIDVVTLEGRLEWVPSDPRCGCSSSEGAPAETATWARYLSKRFAPIHPQPLRTDGAPARVIFRATASLRRVDRGAFGVALGTGPHAETIALAEGIERYCMLRPPVAADAAAARDLELPHWTPHDVRSLLFPVRAYALPRFRFAPFDEDEPTAWTRVVNLGGAHSLIPTCLVGRPPARSRRLVDPTSNGYAAHLDRVAAVRHAILELVERDALLRAWLSRAAPPRVGGFGVHQVALPASVTLHAIPAAVDVAVVLAVGRRPDGGARVGSAAAPSFIEAARRALAELDVALRRPVGPLRVDLMDPATKATPLDHVAYYDDPRRCGPIDELTAAGGEVAADELRDRWPEETDDRAVSLDAMVRGADIWLADASYPEVFGEWHVVRAISPSLIEMSWGVPYLRIPSLPDASSVRSDPHPFG